MKRFVTMIMASATLGIGALVLAQTSPAPGQQEYPTTTSPPGSSGQAMPSSAGADPVMRIGALVPSGMSTEEACRAFKSVIECAASLHAAQNTGIPFNDLKSRVTGGEKLGVAIHALKPEADAQSEVFRAVEQAQADLRVAPQG